MNTVARVSSLPGGIGELRHRLRTPLNHILGYTEILLEEMESTAAAEPLTHLRSIHEMAKDILASLQNSIALPGQEITEKEIEAFRIQIGAPLHSLARSVGALLSLIPDSLALDVLRIATATAELMDFARSNTEDLPLAVRAHAASSPNVHQEVTASVLIMDDDEANRDILSWQLQKSGFSVSAAENGTEGLAKLKRESFDIVLIDFMMPGMNALDVLDSMKEDSATEDIPVIIISALDELSGMSRCIEHGADDYLFKPFDQVLLSTRIRAALERKRLCIQERERTKELEHISQKLQRSNEDLKRFAYAASHDLQAPLRTITTHLQLLERRVSKLLASEDLDLIRFPVEAALRMNQLIKDLLTYSQVSTGHRRLEQVPCEEVVLATLDDLKTAIAESGAQVAYDPLPTITADAVELRQLFLNLIGNAIKYRSEAPPHISIKARRSYRSWHFTVSDNGVGIPSEHLDTVFELFRRLHGQETPGTGLGLSICKRIIDRFGGRIWAESQVGVGSTFHFTIPDEQHGESM